MHIERREHVPKELLAFSFLCDADAVYEARTVLSSVDGVTLVPDVREGLIRIIPDDFGRIQFLTGTQVSGFCLQTKQEAVVKKLAERGIAGYSRETQVLFQKASDIFKGFSQ